MTDDDLIKLKKRLGDGKAWIEKIKLQDKYTHPESRKGIQLFSLLGNQVLEEENKRGAARPASERHSKAWMDMLGREEKDEARRERNRIAARERAERKRKGIK